MTVRIKDIRFTRSITMQFSLGEEAVDASLCIFCMKNQVSIAAQEASIPVCRTDKCLAMARQMLNTMSESFPDVD